MADDPNPTLRAQLQAALAVLAPQIRGLHDLANTSISGDLRNLVTNQISFREHRRDLILAVIAALNAVIDALNNLESDGYPALDPVELTGSLFQELVEEINDIASGAGVFASEMRTIGLDLSRILTHPQPVPEPPGP